MIKLKEGIWFNGNGDVFATQAAMKFSSEQIGAAVKLALSHTNDFHLQQAACGGTGPFDGKPDMDFEEYLALKQKFEEQDRIDQGCRAAKKKHTAIRRREYGSVRSDLYLAMIDAGISHKCYFSGCNEVEILTIDHKLALSRGGTDAVTNLQFACRKHNSSKGDR